MTHPFFDAARFPWHRPDAQALHRVLTDTIRQQARVTLLYDKSAAGLRPLTPAAADQMWQEALDNLAASGAIGPFIAVLLQEQLAPAARTVVEAVQRAVPSVESLVGDSGPGLVLLDREVLRGHIKRMTPNGAPLKVIMVRGEPSSGKSHGRHLFELAGRDQRAEVIYLNADMVATVEEVIGELFGALDALDDVPQQGETTTSAFHKNVWLRLKTVAARKQRQLWIAVDDLGKAADGGLLLDPDVRDFLDQLVSRLPNPGYRDWFRLMLIHYPEGKAPTQWQRDVYAEDRTAGTDVRVEHIAAALRSWAGRHGRKILDSEIDALAADILRDADDPAAGTTDCCRLQRLHDLVSTSLESLVGDRP